jgi:hypothetical protein
MNKNLFCAHGGIKERKGSKKEHNKEREREKTKSKKPVRQAQLCRCVGTVIWCFF